MLIFSKDILHSVRRSFVEPHFADTQIADTQNADWQNAVEFVGREIESRQGTGCRIS
jgi:hypothetical protein